MAYQESASQRNRQKYEWHFWYSFDIVSCLCAFSVTDDVNWIVLFDGAYWIVPVGTSFFNWLCKLCPPCSLVSPKRVVGCRVGVGMLRGFLLSWFLGFKIRRPLQGVERVRIQEQGLQLPSIQPHQARPAQPASQPDQPARQPARPSQPDSQPANPASQPSQPS